MASATAGCPRRPTKAMASGRLHAISASFPTGRCGGSIPRGWRAGLLTRGGDRLQHLPDGHLGGARASRARAGQAGL